MNDEEVELNLNKLLKLLKSIDNSMKDISKGINRICEEFAVFNERNYE